MLDYTHVLKAVKDAGHAMLEIQQGDLGETRKANNDLVTKADLIANEILKSSLSFHFPDIGWLSEESVDDTKRLMQDRVWIVDPIDGTIEYAEKRPEFAISIALVEEGAPIFAVVYNPATNEFFNASRGRGAWLNQQQIFCDPKMTEPMTLLASRSEYQRGEWAAYEKQHNVKQVGSIAYKLALVAAGKAHATFSLGPKNEWDIAAGVLLVSEAGGIVTDKKQRPFRFNQANVKVDGIVATTKQAQSKIFTLIE